MNRRWNRGLKAPAVGGPSQDWGETAMIFEGSPVAARDAAKACAFARITLLHEHGFEKVPDHELDELERISQRLLQLSRWEPTGVESRDEEPT